MTPNMITTSLFKIKKHPWRRSSREESFWQRPALLLLLAAVCTGASAQGTLADYRRAYGTRERLSGKMLHGSVRATAVESRNRHLFWYTDHDELGTCYTLVDADRRTKSELVRRDTVAAQLTRQTGKKVAAGSLPLAQIKVTDSPLTVSFVFNNRHWTYDPSRLLITKGDTILPHPKAPYHHWMEVPEEKDGRAVRPDSSATMIARDCNLWLITPSDTVGTAVTTDGTPRCYYSSWGQWSADGRYYATVKITPAPKRYVTYINSSPTDQLQPKYYQQEYAKPGDSLNYRVPVIIDVETRRVIVPSTELFQKQYYVTAPQWDKNNQTVTFEFNERGHKHYRVLEMSALTGNVRTLIEEAQPKYVNYSQNYRYDFADGRHILWASERDGYRHLYLYDRKTAKVIRQITKGQFYVRGIQKVDEKAGVIYFSANGMNPHEDPYLIHYYKIRLNGRGLTSLTPEEGTHQAVYSDDMKYLIDTYSTAVNPPISVLRKADDGAVVLTLEKADISKLKAAGWRAPEIFTAKGRDGKTDIWGLIQRPSNFDPAKKYPVIEYVYSGPGDQYVPKQFTPWNWTMSDLAELGFIVVQADGMTTSFRSKAFEEVCYKNLKDAGFPDRIQWIKAAATRYPYMDISNMAIYGCSAGGQEALAALLFYNDFYKVAYAACGCHDNRMDKIWWNEQWMGYPVDSSYVACSNTENAARLKGKLMLVVGELDDNVDPSSSFQVVNALEKANKDFEFIYLPGAHHTMGEAFGEHKRYDFFVRNLLGVEPPAWEDVLKK